MARRFIVNKEDIRYLPESDEYTIKGNEVKHIQVLRHDIGDNITINNEIYEITKIKKDEIILKYIKEAPLKGIPKVNITLYMAFLKSDKMDFVVQKAVEIGVKKIVPFFSSNVIVKLEEKDRIKRRQKLQKIADEACKQCGRMDIVEVEEFENFQELKNTIENEEKVFFAYEASEDSLKREINVTKENKYSNIGIIIGAEGGFTPKEANELEKIENVSCVSLGKRILRAETAALNLLSILMYEMEE